MSFSLGIHLWWNEDPDLSSSLVKSILKSVAEPSGRSLNETREALPPKIQTVQIFEKCFKEIHRESVETDNLDAVISTLGDLHENRCYVVSTWIEYLEYESGEDEVAESITGMDAVFFGREYCLGGTYYKTRGRVELSISNVNIFAPDPGLSGDSDRHRTFIEQLNTNYETVIEPLVSRLIAECKPSHLLVCTEAEVHPLTCHTMYHQDWHEFFADLTKIARLHEEGGVYFCETMIDDPARQLPRKTGLDYGYLRGKFEQDNAAALVERLEPLSDKLLNEEIVPNNYSLETLEQIFAQLKQTKVMKVDDGYLLSAHGSPFSYLEEPYFDLFEAVLKSN